MRRRDGNPAHVSPEGSDGGGGGGGESFLAQGGGIGVAVSSVCPLRAETRVPAATVIVTTYR